MEQQKEKNMKKSMILVMMSLSVMLLISCGPSACKCGENAIADAGNYDADLGKKCDDHEKGLTAEERAVWTEEWLDCMQNVIDRY